MTYPSFFTETPAAVYVPFRQHLWQYGREDEWLHTRKVLAVRTSVDPLTLIRPIGLSRALNSMFWRLTVADPLVLTAISALMLVAGLLAAWAACPKPSSTGRVAHVSVASVD